MFHHEQRVTLNTDALMREHRLGPLAIRRRIPLSQLTGFHRPLGSDAVGNRLIDGDEITLLGPCFYPGNVLEWAVRLLNDHLERLRDHSQTVPPELRRASDPGATPRL